MAFEGPDGSFSIQACRLNLRFCLLKILQSCQCVAILATSPVECTRSKRQGTGAPFDKLRAGFQALADARPRREVAKRLGLRQSFRLRGAP
jgi:hypothetical protein